MLSTDSSSVKKDGSDLADAAISDDRHNPIKMHIALSPENGNGPNGSENIDSQFNGDTSMQLVLYDPKENGSNEYDTAHRTPPSTGHSSKNLAPRVLPSVGAFTVQCADCFKWRLIPTKEKYEEIREHILDAPFVCQTAREWRPEISCDDPPDIQQDGSRLWAIDKPNIAQPPPGWDRQLRIRGEGGSKFADVYYIAPTGKRLRSMVDVQRYLFEHPEYVGQGVTLSQFSFQIPKPLQENYVRKRPARFTGPSDDPCSVPRPLELTEANPLSWASPDDSTVLRLGGPGLSATEFSDSSFNSSGQPAKKARKASKSSKQRQIVDTLKYHHQMFGDSHEPKNASL